MFPQAKRRRTGDYARADAKLDEKRAQQGYRLKSRFESIFDKYEKNFDGIGDEIDLETGEIIVDRGHLKHMRYDTDVGNGQADKIVKALEIVDSSDDQSSVGLTASSDQNFAEDFAIRSAGEIEDHRVVSSEGKLPGMNNPDEVDPACNELSLEMAAIGAVENEEDELAIGMHKDSSTNSVRKKAVNTRTNGSNKIDPKWVAPPLPHDAFKTRPVHRRKAHVSPLKIQSYDVFLGNWLQKDSVWDMRPEAPPERYTLQDRTSRSLQEEHDEEWTQDENQVLWNLKEQENLPLDAIAKYFPRKTPASIEANWRFVKWERQKGKGHAINSDAARSDRSPEAFLDASMDLTGEELPVSGRAKAGDDLRPREVIVLEDSEVDDLNGNLTKFASTHSTLPEPKETIRWMNANTDLHINLKQWHLNTDKLPKDLHRYQPFYMQNPDLVPLDPSITEAQRILVPSPGGVLHDIGLDYPKSAQKTALGESTHSEVIFINQFGVAHVPVLKTKRKRKSGDASDEREKVSKSATDGGRRVTVGREKIKSINNEKFEKITLNRRLKKRRETKAYNAQFLSAKPAQKEMESTQRLSELPVSDAVNGDAHAKIASLRGSQDCWVTASKSCPSSSFDYDSREIPDSQPSQGATNAVEGISTLEATTSASEQAIIMTPPGQDKSRSDLTLETSGLRVVPQTALPSRIITPKSSRGLASKRGAKDANQSDSGRRKSKAISSLSLSLLCDESDDDLNIARVTLATPYSGKRTPKKPENRNRIPLEARNCGDDELG